MSPSDPDLPRDPAEYRPKSPLGVGFWVFLAFGMICVLAGIAVALLGPLLMSPKDGPAPPAVSVLMPAPISRPPEPYPANAEPGRVTPDEVGNLKARIAELEQQGARSSEAAAAALALAAVADASQSSRPFSAEYQALRQAAPSLPEPTALTRLAETGAPSRSALAVSFELVAARASSRSRKPPKDAGLGARIAYAAGKVVTIRRVGDVEGEDPDALVARAELALQDGDVVAALALLDRLPSKGRATVAAWREGAERRAAIDRDIAALRLRAARDLTQDPRPNREGAP